MAASADPASSRNSILLRSGWATSNIGDVGHTPGTLRYLAENLPEARVTLWLAVTSPAVTAMLQRRFLNVPIVSGDMDANGRATDPELQRAFDDADLFVMNSGMLFTGFWPGPDDLLRACVGRGLPFGLFGQSFDAFQPGDEAERIALLSQARFIFCRDNESLAYLRRAGAQPGALEFGPDGCFGIDVRDEATAGAFLAHHGLETGRFITVTIRTNTPKLGKSGNGDPLNPGVPTAAHVEQDEHWAAQLRTIIEAWVRDGRGKVLLAPEVDKEISAAKRLLLDRLPADVQAQVVHRDTFWTVEEAASVYARAACVVSAEPHSCIIALAAGTPILHTFSRRHGLKAWMFRDIGLPEWLIDIDAEPASRMVDALRRIDDDPQLSRAKVARAMAFVNAREAEMVREIRTTLAMTKR
ncbi:MAG TPA: polysaccharide pyruvyl transferase family protein [Tepidisphaeraceae bacterium]|jgi:polysaccharide pyruvyl transferase WcaK-like protein|nr:polysaccharide pyruvyl transferase family protein [Tepidisphaeraceae bacterium]